MNHKPTAAHSRAQHNATMCLFVRFVNEALDCGACRHKNVRVTRKSQFYLTLAVITHYFSSSVDATRRFPECEAQQMLNWFCYAEMCGSNVDLVRDPQ